MYILHEMLEGEPLTYKRLEDSQSMNWSVISCNDRKELERGPCNSSSIWQWSC